MPFGQMPILETDGVVLSQSMSIARFVAKEAGLAGKDNITAAKADMIVDTIHDFKNGENISAVCGYCQCFVRCSCLCIFHCSKLRVDL